MLEEFICSGFGGQGVLLVGQVVCLAAVRIKKQACWVPSYGPEMRGGTANCLFVVSDEKIGSPLVTTPTVLLCMNQPSMEKFGKSVLPGGLIVSNANHVSNVQAEEKVKVVHLPAADIAKSLGNSKCENMVVLGAYAGARPLFTVDELFDAFKYKVGEGKSKIFDLNRKALQAGFDWAKNNA